MRDFNLTRGSQSFSKTMKKHKSNDSRYKTLTQNTIFDCFTKDVCYNS